MGWVYAGCVFAFYAIFYLLILFARNRKGRRNSAGPRHARLTSPAQHSRTRSWRPFRRHRPGSAAPSGPIPRRSR